MKYVGSKDKNIKYKPRPGAYAIIIGENEKKVGIVTDGDGFFYLGGGIEKGETELEALKRELIEESGYSIKNIKEFKTVGEYLYAENKGYLEVIANVYIAEFDKKVAEPIEKDHTVLWVEPEEYASKMFREWQRYIMESFIEERGKGNMRIGIDIDNVISNFNDELLKEYLEHDKKLRNTGIINENPHHITQGMFDWTKEENDDFYYNNIERIAKKLKPLSRAAEIISKLKNENNEIYIISSRDNGEYTNPKEMTEKWLSDNNIQYDVLILTYKGEKGKICKENNIDIMIDDSINNCKDVSEYGIKVLLMETRYNKHVTEFEKVSNWREIYKKIKESYPKKEQEKINVILDTDTFNECDDQFAVSYMIKSQERFNIEAITIAPYHHDNDISIEEGLEKSYQEVLKICKWLDFNTESKVFKGATDYLANGYNKTNEAVEKIIGIALKNEKTYIMAIGAITNVAMAIMKEPRIIDKIEVIWLGGHSILIKDNMEFNFRQDIEAVRTVFESKVKLTVIPCKNVASNLKTTIYEIEHHLKNKNEVGTYLCERFYNDGKHGIQTRRVIWDISVIAYLINKEWFEISQINCPNIKEDTSYELNTNNRLITMVDFIDSDKIYEDMFEKLGEKNEINE